ncbi:hypothetical protein [Gemmata obscuriglobus]|uniref:hypothetical protein n=1 Tax=Gemmata obscuriglobus TaxID=114 RepID=UPI0011CD5A88|nr:hypothetical protein [Gemmata obscuriglobus]
MGEPLGHRVTNAPPGLIAAARTLPIDAGYHVCTHSVLTASRALSAGVKVFRLSPHEADVLANCDADISAADYVQPFPTMFYALPEELQAGTDGEGEGRWPFVAVDRLAPGRVVVTGFIARPPYTGDSRAVTAFHIYPDDERSVAVNIGDTLDRKTASVIHIALNAGLYLSVRGTTERHANPGRVKALKRRKREQHHEWRDIQRQLKREPVLVEPVRRIEIRPSSLAAHDTGPPTGLRQRPHERRGHFRMQACGPRRAERKLVFIEPYAVGGRRDFGGTHTEYTLAY